MDSLQRCRLSSRGYCREESSMGQRYYYMGDKYIHRRLCYYPKHHKQFWTFSIQCQ